MDNKQKEQMKKGLVFGGLGLLFALSMWFIFAPSNKDKTAAERDSMTASRRQRQKSSPKTSSKPMN